MPHNGVVSGIGKRIGAGLCRQIVGYAGKNELVVNLRGLRIENLLQAKTKFERVSPLDQREIVVEIGNLLLKCVAGGNRPPEIRRAADRYLRTRAGQGAPHVLLISVGPAKAQFVQHGRRQGGEQLGAQNVSAVMEIRRYVECVQSADASIIRIFVTEVVVAHKELMLVADRPVKTNIDELGVLNAGRDLQQARAQTNRRRIG